MLHGRVQLIGSVYRSQSVFTVLFIPQSYMTFSSAFGTESCAVDSSTSLASDHSKLIVDDANCYSVLEAIRLQSLRELQQSMRQVDNGMHSHHSIYTLHRLCRDVFKVQFSACTALFNHSFVIIN
jgi:hypothetical protein